MKFITTIIFAVALFFTNVWSTDYFTLIQEHNQRANDMFIMADKTPPASFARSLLVFNRPLNSADQRQLAKQTSAKTWTSIEQEWENSAWVNVYRDIMTFDVVHHQITSMLSYEWQNGAWEKSMRMTGELTASGELKSLTIETWKNNAWALEMKMTYEYDGNGNNVLMVMQFDENEDGTLENFMKTEMSYDGNGYLVEEKYFNWDNGAWMETQKTTYANNAQGLPIEEISQFSVGGGEYMNVSKTTFTYDGNGNELVVTDYNADFATQGWIESSRTSYTYDGKGLNTQTLDEMWAGAWVNGHLETMTYNNAGQEIESLDQDWDGSAWLNTGKENTSFDGNGQAIESIFQVWNGSWQNDTRWLYEYTGTLVQNDIKQPNHFTLSNYPNPFNPSTTISFTLPTTSRVTLQIFDTNGTLIKTLLDNAVTEAGQHSRQWNGTNSKNQSAASGVYWYRLTSADYQQTARGLLLK